MTIQESQSIAALRREVALQFEQVKQMFAERETRYMERFDAADEQVKTALTSAKEAVIKAEIATEKRFETARVETETRMGFLEKGTAAMGVNMSTAAGRSAGIGAFWGYLVGAVGLGMAIIGGILAFSQ